MQKQNIVCRFELSNDLRLRFDKLKRNLEPFGRVLGTQTGERLKGFLI